jgi:hypothetical protein
MNKLFLILAAAAASVPAQIGWSGSATAQARARGVADPRAFVAATYARYQSDPNVPPPDQSRAYSPRLRALFAAYDRDLSGGDLVGSLDFDWWTNAQDVSISRVAVTERRHGPNRRTITARFANYGAPEEVRFLFVRQGDRWYLDDAVQGSGRGSDGWTLSALLRERP